MIFCSVVLVELIGGFWVGEDSFGDAGGSESSIGDGSGEAEDEDVVTISRRCDLSLAEVFISSSRLDLRDGVEDGRGVGKGFFAVSVMIDVDGVLLISNVVIS